MKKLIASILTVLTVGASAQLTYVTTLEENDNFEPPLVIEFGDNLIEGKTYFISSSGNYDSKTNSYEYYNILNSDFSLYKRITIDTTGWGVLNYYLNNWDFSNHLFNADDKIEMTYNIKRLNGPGDWSYTYPVRTVVIDEDGVELQIINDVTLSGHEPFLVDGKTYLSGRNSNGETAIYEAAGTLPCKTCSSTEATPTQKAPEKAYDINVFPNPTTNQITLAINTDKTGMKVHIYSTDGKLVKSASVVNGNNLIDTADLVSGTYIYNVQTDTEVIHASQFIKK